MIHLTAVPTRALLAPFAGATIVAALLVLPSTSAGQQADSAALVTRLGNDTIAVERWVRTPALMEVEVVLRSPRTTRGRYSFEMNDDGSLSHYEGSVWEGGVAEGSPVRRTVVESDGRKLAYSISHEGEEPRTGVLDLDPWALPFIDMIHWPFELMLIRARASGEASLSPQVFSGEEGFSLEVEQGGGGVIHVTHPTLGTMDVTVDDQGRMTALSAARETLRLEVTREPWLDIEAYAADFVARDAAGGDR